MCLLVIRIGVYSCEINIVGLVIEDEVGFKLSGISSWVGVLWGDRVWRYNGVVEVF